jgi:peptide/nickel transport system ATP-binding protein
LTAPLLQVEDLAISFRTDFGVLRAVREVSFSVAAGQIFGLVGESGCGKSTVAYALLGDLGEGASYYSGRVLFKGRDLLSLDSRALRGVRGAEIAMVQQNPAEALNPSSKVGKQLAEVLAVHSDMEETSAHRRILELLDRVHLADAARMMDRYPHELSGGQQQRVVIALALLGKPNLLVLDEPTTGLDVTVEAAVLDLLREIRDTLGVAIVYIAHNLGAIAQVSDRVGVMYAGELVEEAPAAVLFNSPRHPYTIGLLQCVPRVDRPVGRQGLSPIPGSVLSPYALSAGCLFAERCGHARPRCRENRPDLLSCGEERQVRCFRWAELPGEAHTTPPATKVASRVMPSDGTPLLEIAALRVHYPIRKKMSAHRRYIRAVEDVSLALSRGQILAIVGESGCGKSSLGWAIIGLQRPSSGRLKFRGEDISRPAGRRSVGVHQLLQMIFQDHGSTLNPSLSVGSIVMRPLRLFSNASRREIRQESVRLLRAVDLDETVLRRRSFQLSGGQRQRVAIARAFAGKPQLVICDEITSALDVSVQASVLNFLLRLQQENATSLLFISHDLGVVRYLADQIAVMYLGHICETGSADAVFGGPNHPYTQALLSAVPIPNPTARASAVRLHGPLPSPLAFLPGCPFHTRCPRKIGPICEAEVPPWRDAGSGHRIWCHLQLSELASEPDRPEVSQATPCGPAAAVGCPPPNLPQPTMLQP